MIKLKKKVIVTTSREPSPRTRSFVKDLSSLAEWIIKLNRGKLTFRELVDQAILSDSTTLAVIGEMRGNPSIVRLYDLTDAMRTGKVLHTYSIMLKGIALSREAMHSGVDPHLVKEIVIESPQVQNEESRDVVFAIHQLLNTGVEPPQEGKHIKVSINTTYRIIRFRLYPGAIGVGPVIKYIRVKPVKKMIELGEEAESA